MYDSNNVTKGNKSKIMYRYKKSEYTNKGKGIKNNTW